MTSGAVNGQLNNFISSNDAASATGAPVDSFMVYIGAGVDGPTVFNPTNPVLYSDGHVDTVYDKKHRWFDEVIHWDRDPNSDPSNPTPLYYRGADLGQRHQRCHPHHADDLERDPGAPMLQKSGRDPSRVPRQDQQRLQR